MVKMIYAMKTGDGIVAEEIRKKINPKYWLMSRLNLELELRKGEERTRRENRWKHQTS